MKRNRSSRVLMSDFEEELVNETHLRKHVLILKKSPERTTKSRMIMNSLGDDGSRGGEVDAELRETRSSIPKKRQWDEEEMKTWMNS
ncbi:hypothetical protein AVEN_4637-1 [Araneus ventricosus]|uniref:Uncharacterized protein n=1 Tax=Araneus ventricosus TaxID=182803 RepID=A0A4Y2LKB2_ARAVE|nr:hypothetical protein AVEN_4637-1 [Araneus ventricosus]